jgi:hypothetical protein
MKDAQATEEAFSSQKRASITSKHENSVLFFYFRGSVLPSWIRIRNLNADPDPNPATQINAVPDPQPWRFQDRELQLFDGTRLMSAAKFEDLKAAEGLTEAQLETRGVRKIHPAFR